MFGKIVNKLKIITVLFSFFALPLAAYAQEARIKDTDLDGVADEAEINLYKTDPSNPDSDGDGVLDYKEILDGTNPNDANSNKVIEIQSVQTPSFFSEDHPTMWYVGRISGIASFVMFTVVIVFGLLMTSKILLKYRFLFPGEALETHMFTATFIAFILLILHIISFFFDDFVKLKIIEVFVPLTFNRDVMSALNFDLKIPVSLGVIALYLAILLLVTSHLRNKIVSGKTWRKIHYSSFLFYILFLIHGITAGTDSTEPWMIAIYAISVVLVLGLTLLRIFGKKYFMPKPKAKITSTGENPENKIPSTLDENKVSTN